MTKARRTLTLDHEIVPALGADPSTLWATVNSILSDEIARRAGRATLVEFLDRLDAEFGKPDPTEVERFRRLLA